MSERGRERVLLSRRDVRLIGSAPISFTDRARIAEAARVTIEELAEVHKRNRGLSESHTAMKMHADELLVRNRGLETEVNNLRTLQGQALGNAIFDSYARHSDEMAGLVSLAERRVKELEGELALIRGKGEVK